MTDTVYRFLPWSRRGLAAALPPSADGAAVPGRATVEISVVVGGGAGPVPTSATLHGPGDVIGLDPTVIVRTLPRPGATDVEPNYLVAVDFDQPELPWLFTPTGVPPSGHLKPWLVLVVVRERAGVSLTVPAGAMLPVLSIDDKASEELPDLADSWAWAHVQLLDADAGSTTDAVGAALADRPDHNVSRLVCPRRLLPNERWIACLVPAFDAGVKRGFGATPPEGNLEPAWTDPSSIKLPVYHHWRFQTGPEGDFESLARRLKPYEASARIGRVKMHIGDAMPGFVDLPSGDAQRFLDMDGALQAPAVARTTAQPPVPDPQLSDVPAAVADGIAIVTRVLADAADGTIDNQVDPAEDPALGPPVYLGAHLRRTWVTDTDPTWFRELGTDPRCRVAAGLGAEVMRKYQEDVMEACWQQVGDVLALEAALSRARLSLEVSLRFNARHLEPLSPGRYLQITSPLADRSLLDGVTVPVAIEPTSLPARATDAAMRRFVASTGRVVTGIRRRARTAAVVGAARASGDRLVTTLADGRTDVDPTRFPVPAIDGLTESMPPAAGDGTVSLERFGVDVVVDRAGAAALTKASRAVTTAPELAAADRLEPRPDLLSTGMVTSAHVLASREIAAEQLAAKVNRLAADERPPVVDVVDSSASSVMDQVLATAAERPGEVGFLVETGPRLTVSPLALAGREEVVVVTAPGRANLPVARLSTRLRGDTAEVADIVAALPNNALVTPARGGRAGAIRAELPVELVPGAAAGHVDVRPRAGGPAARPDVTTITVPPLVKDSATIRRYREAVAELADRTVLAQDPLAPHLVPFALNRAVAATRERVDPLVVHPARLDTMVSLGGSALSAVLADPALLPAWLVPPRLDRVMTYPRLDLAAYAYLAEYDRTRFCPGVDEVPPESITLLETNPRFVAGFMGGLNHETNRELIWRGYPSDGRGTPWQKFWKRTDNGPDIFPIDGWGMRSGHDDLPWQTVDPLGNLVLLLRGNLLRRYPNTMAIAVRAVRVGGVQKPSDDADDLRTPVFAGKFDPDVSFFGFPLVSADLTTGEGWFFGLMEPVTEPRFGFDETVGRETTNPTNWNDVAWPDLGVAPAGLLTVAQLATLGLAPSVGQADGVAAALFQRPFKLLVHARHLVKGI